MILGELASREQLRTLWRDSVKRLRLLDAVGRRSFLEAFRDHVGIVMLPDRCDHSSASCHCYGMMTRPEVWQLATAGQHSRSYISHLVLVQMLADAAYTEIIQSQTRLEAALERPVWAFAYPFGDLLSVIADVMRMPRKG